MEEPIAFLTFADDIRLVLKETFRLDYSEEILRMVVIALWAHEIGLTKDATLEKLILERAEKTYKKAQFLFSSGKVDTVELESLIKSCSAREEIDEAFMEFLILDYFLCSYIADGYLITTERMLEWIKRAWQAGGQEKRVQACEIGGVWNLDGLAINYAAHLALWGRKEGYLNSNIHRERKILIRNPDATRSSIDTGQICPVGMEYCWSCGQVAPLKVFRKAGKCPNPTCSDPHRWDD